MFYDDVAAWISLESRPRPFLVDHTRWIAFRNVVVIYRAVRHEVKLQRPARFLLGLATAEDGREHPGIVQRVDIFHVLVMRTERDEALRRRPVD